MLRGLFSQVCVLGAGGLLLTSLIPLWRRHLPAFVTAYRWQSVVLAGTTAAVAYFGDAPDLYLVAAVVLALKAVVVPRLLRNMELRFGRLAELQPYVNTTTAMLASAVLVIFGYAVTRPIVQVSTLPTREGMPLAIGMVLVSLFTIVTRKKALTQVIGLLMLENAITLLAVLGTYGVPLIVELGVFLDALMAFLVMQIFVYRIHETFESIDVEQLSGLRH